MNTTTERPNEDDRQPLLPAPELSPEDRPTAEQVEDYKLASEAARAAAAQGRQDGEPPTRQRQLDDAAASARSTWLYALYLTRAEVEDAAERPAGSLDAAS